MLSYVKLNSKSSSPEKGLFIVQMGELGGEMLLLGGTRSKAGVFVVKKLINESVVVHL